MAQRRRLHDRYFKQAKAEGYLARSAYKLKQIEERKRIIRKGDRAGPGARELAAGRGGTRWPRAWWPDRSAPVEGEVRRTSA